MSACTVSFVIPAYNAGASLRETLSSLQEQTRRDWQAIVVDDGSTDGTADVAAVLAGADSRIQVLRVDHGGVSRARNHGLVHVEAPWVTFLDADDLVAPEFCDVMLEHARTHADVVYCGYRRLTPDGETMLDSFTAALKTDALAILARRNPLAVHAAMTRRDILTGLGGFDATLVTCEEWDLWRRVARSGARFVGVAQILALYRTRKDSLSRQHRQVLKDGLTVLRRGLEPDPRVPRPAHACGLANAEFEIHKTFLVTWYAAAELGAGGEAAPLLTVLEGRGNHGGCLANLGRTVIEGFLVGTGATPQHMVERWPQLLPCLCELFEQIVSSSNAKENRLGSVYALERGLLSVLPAGPPVELTRVARVTVDLSAICDVRFRDGVDLAVVDLASRRTPVRRIEHPVWGPWSRRDVAEVALREVGGRAFVHATDQTGSPRYWLTALWLLLKHAPLLRVRGRGRVALLRETMRRAAGEAALHRYGPLVNGTHGHRLREVLSEVAPPVPPTTPRSNGGLHQTPGPEAADRRPALWDAIFAAPDPWQYNSAYEQEKYAHTLGLLPSGTVASALELACAEGIFTAQLAPRVERLLATDVSARALARARDRCAAHRHVVFRQLDLVSDPLPGEHEVIICSEVLYYLDGRNQLSSMADKIRAALVPGGRLLMAHYFLLKDDMASTGFDWEQAYGGKIIHDVFAACPGLALERSIVTELYRVDCFRRVEPGDVRSATDVRRAMIGSVLDARLARDVVWGGASARRHDVAQRERTWWLPVLLYHRIAAAGAPRLKRWRVEPDAFRAQLRLLRAHGYHSVTSADVRAHRLAQQPIPGRPVLITFDDGYEDFATTAWPILEAEGFTAEVFIVTDRVGQTASWDAEEGEPPVRLMDWETIKGLHELGARFGSHLATHSPGTALSSVDLLHEAVRSRAALQARLGTEILSVAAPYGAIDERLKLTLDAAGYRIGFSCEAGLADVRRPDALTLPRFTAEGEWTLADFSSALDLPPWPPSGTERPEELVTVIVPAYNAAGTIDQSLRSVRGQTHRHLEILVVDDGSQDDTAAIVAQHAAEDARIRLIRQANAGVAAARNRALAEATAALVAPIDADDLWAPTKIERQLRALRRGGPDVALVYTWQAIIDDHGMVTSDEYQPADEGRVIRQMLLSNWVGGGSVPLMRTQAVVEAGGYETGLHAAGAQGCEDLLLYFRIAERYQFALVPEHLTGYRQHERNMSGDALRMMRSYRMVAREMRLAYPEHRALVSRGEALMARWLLVCAVRAGHLTTAAILLGGVLRTNPRYGSAEVLRHACVSVMRRLWRRARSTPTVMLLKPFLAVAPPEGHS